jgi:hypothetical protein
MTGRSDGRLLSRGRQMAEDDDVIGMAAALKATLGIP